MTIGRVWTEEDHAWLMRQVEQIDKLAQTAHNARRIKLEIGDEDKPL